MSVNLRGYRQPRLQLSTVTPGKQVQFQGESSDDKNKPNPAPSDPGQSAGEIIDAVSNLVKAVFGKTAQTTLNKFLNPLKEELSSKQSEAASVKPPVEEEKTVASEKQASPQENKTHSASPPKKKSTVKAQTFEDWFSQQKQWELAGMTYEGWKNSKDCFFDYQQARSYGEDKWKENTSEGKFTKACETLNKTVVKQFLQSDLDVVKDPNYLTNGISYFLDAGADSGKRRGGDLEMVKLFLSRPEFDVNRQLPGGDTILHRAAYHSTFDIIVEILKQPDVDVDSHNQLNKTPLMETPRRYESSDPDGAKIAQLLIDHGAKVNAAGGKEIFDKEGKNYTPLYYAVKYFQPALVEVLITNGADTTIRFDGQSLRELAESGRNFKGIDVDKTLEKLP